MTHGSLFSGIGGFDLAAEWMGWDNKFHCEINPFCQKVLHYYWPNAEQFTDIKQTDFTKYANSIDVLTGGFPCQPFSVGGSRKGKDDDRYLWPEMLRAIREIKPRWIVGENVRGLVNWSRGLVFKQIKHDLEIEGYFISPYILPALSVDADHLRERIWFVAYSTGMGREDVQGNVRSSRKKMEYIQRRRPKKQQWHKETDRMDSSGNTFLRFQEMYGKPAIFDVDDGLPFELDGITVSKWVEESLKGAGNAVVPQIPYKIFQAIEQYENLNL